MTATVQSFHAGSLITIQDAIIGARKLVRVTQTGHTYVDTDGEDAAPMPITSQLAPEAVGDMLSWGLYLVDQEPQHYTAFNALCKQLTASSEPPLFYNRAAYWAFANRDFDFDRSMQAARRETELINNSWKLARDWIDSNQSTRVS